MASGARYGRQKPRGSDPGPFERISLGAGAAEPPPDPPQIPPAGPRRGRQEAAQVPPRCAAPISPLGLAGSATERRMRRAGAEGRTVALREAPEDLRSPPRSPTRPLFACPLPEDLQSPHRLRAPLVAWSRSWREAGFTRTTVQPKARFTPPRTAPDGARRIRPWGILLLPPLCPPTGSIPVLP
eukprot:tig00021013_g17072.t1